MHSCVYFANAEKQKQKKKNSNAGQSHTCFQKFPYHLVFSFSITKDLLFGSSGLCQVNEYSLTYASHFVFSMIKDKTDDKISCKYEEDIKLDDLAIEKLRSILREKGLKVGGTNYYYPLNFIDSNDHEFKF